MPPLESELIEDEEELLLIPPIPPLLSALMEFISGADAAVDDEDEVDDFICLAK